MFGRHGRGHSAEQTAADFLTARGLKIVARNYRTRRGEIDLIAEDGESLVFVEVRARRSKGFGSAATSVGRDKQRKLIAAASAYLQQHHATERACRFDVITLDGPAGDAKIDWIVDAFRVSG